jgi:hypothetical protein
MIAILAFILFEALQDPVVPYRNKEDFTVELKYDLRSRPAAQANTLHLDPTGVKTQRTGMLPYLIVAVKITNVTPQEVRFKCEDNEGHTRFSKKLPKAATFMIDMGFIDDVKDQLAPNSYEVFAMSKEKTPVNRIHLRIEKDGTFLVNGEKRGKF